MHFNYRSKHKHEKSCFINARILLESFYKKGKKLRKKMKSGKSKTRKSRKSRKSWKSYPEFSILPYSQNRKLGFKNLGKKFPRFPRFPSFRPGLLIVEYNGK